jgi:hypothetical protein
MPLRYFIPIRRAVISLPPPAANGGWPTYRPHLARHVTARPRGAVGVAAGAHSGRSRCEERAGAPAGFTGEHRQNGLLPFCYPTR